ncbi:YjgN family protein [Vibrio penaeicida]|uniref:Membrane protein n=1 Tax=Vibrio penaeicida TaxID=104609 RepID=A0AAV5NT69_9VIBR|nr:YjgN family protein [Vibrio penaeicida]RTZ20241.1 DUF898 domain-containing protein [Vibrio penaeicida]GLQ73418.1 membrane protein [Vibrio penaeicida]
MEQNNRLEQNNSIEEKNNKYPFKFEGEGAEFFGIWIVNVLLSVITLGIYSAWAKVRTNQYFYGNTRLDGDGFEYHAKPIQILKGRIIAVVVFIIWSVSNQFAPEVSGVLMLAFLAILPWLAWSNARFDSAMTSYRNVHFSFTGTLKEAYMAILGRGMAIIALFLSAMAAISFEIVPVGVLLLLTIPFVFVWVLVGISNYFANGYRYGKRKFSAQYTVKAYLAIYLKTMLFAFGLSIAFGVVASLFAGASLLSMVSSDFTLSDGGFPNFAFFGLIIAIYIGLFFVGVIANAFKTAQMRNYTFAQLNIDASDQAKSEHLQGDEDKPENTGFAFESTLATWSFVWLIMTNFLLQLVTFGIARPWVMVRTSHFLANHTYVIGDLPNLVVEGEDQDMKSAVSDELSNVFDVDIGIG